MSNDTEEPGLGNWAQRLSQHGLTRRTALKSALAAGAGVATGLLDSRMAWADATLKGFPLARPDKPVTLPLVGDAIEDGLKPESGTFRIFNYAAYLDKKLMDKFGERYDVNVELTTFSGMAEAITKLAHHDVDVDVTEITPDRLSQAVIGKLLQPINHGYIPNFEKNVWPKLLSPYYDRGSRYTVPYTCYKTGIGWRSDKVGEDIAGLDNPWSFFWEAGKYRGHTALLSSSRETLGLAMLHRGNKHINTEDPKIIERALADLQKLNQVVEPRLDENAFRTLPEGRSWLHQAWSGSLLMGAMFYMPEGTSADVLQFWAGPKGDTPIQNDCWAVPAVSRKPVLAHLWMNFILDEQNAYENFTNFTGYQPTINSIDSNRLIADGVIPKNLRTAVVTPDDFGAKSIQYCTLTPKGQRLWQNAYSRFASGV